MRAPALSWLEIAALVLLYLGEGIVFLFSIAGIVIGLWFVAALAGVA